MDPFFQRCRQDPATFPSAASRGDREGTSAAGDGDLRLDENLDAASVVDLDRYFRDKDPTKLTRKTYDNIGLEVRDVLAESDLYERDGKNQFRAQGAC